VAQPPVDMYRVTGDRGGVVSVSTAGPAGDTPPRCLTTEMLSAKPLSAAPCDGQRCDAQRCAKQLAPCAMQLVAMATMRWATVTRIGSRTGAGGRGNGATSHTRHTRHPPHVARPPHVAPIPQLHPSLCHLSSKVDTFPVTARKHDSSRLPSDRRKQFPNIPTACPTLTVLGLILTHCRGCDYFKDILR